MRVLLAAIGLSLVTFACGGATPAPPVGATDVVCSDEFCAAYPVSWTLADSGAAFLSFQHPSAPDDVIATVGRVNMEGLVVANGGQWPAAPRQVVETFWGAIDGGNAELGRIEFRPDGTVESFGVFAGGRMWTRLLPTDAVRAVGVEVRAPDSTWEDHARVFLDGVQLLP
jgi:hypothetical protein